MMEIIIERMKEKKKYIQNILRFKQKRGKKI